VAESILYQATILIENNVDRSDLNGLVVSRANDCARQLEPKKKKEKPGRKTWWNQERTAALLDAYRLTGQGMHREVFALAFARAQKDYFPPRLPVRRPTESNQSFQERTDDILDRQARAIRKYLGKLLQEETEFRQKQIQIEQMTKEMFADLLG
jgi:hypothetical protein